MPDAPRRFMSNPPTATGSELLNRVAKYPLLDALRDRRSRRFGRGMTMPGGPLAFTSARAPVPLTADEEAMLSFAACGVTGPALADLCFSRDGGGSIMAGLAARTVSSGDGIQTVALAMTNDNGTWWLKRPADFEAGELAELIRLGRDGAIAEWFRRSVVRLKSVRSAPSKEPLYNINVNRWSAYAPGTTWFLPVNDVTLMYINGLLEVFNEHTGAFVLDERAGFQPAGLRKFARSRGGHLDDNSANGRVVTVRHIETLVTEFVTIEQGMMLQNLALMAQALGLGGYSSFANHEYGWFEALGFQMGHLPASRYLGAGPLVRFGMRLLGKDVVVPYPIGLTAGGQQLVRPFCPPAFPSMRAAVEAVVDLKFGVRGIFRVAEGCSSWKDRNLVAGSVPRMSEEAVEATVAYCEYLWNRYGRFPVHLAPYRTVLGFQACRLDPDFYEKFYLPDALGPTQREEFRRCDSKSPR